MVVERSGEDSLFSFGVAGVADSQSEAAIVDVRIDCIEELYRDGNGHSSIQLIYGIGRVCNVLIRTVQLSLP